MFEEAMIRYASPTLAGIKTGALFSYMHKSIKKLMKQISTFNKKYIQKGLRLIPLRWNDQSALLYIYRPNLLEKAFHCQQARCLLKDCGYTCANKEHCIIHLMKRLNQSSNFPHEIGIFLGYPIEDVIGFIENKAKGEKMIGTWKVYGDVDEAKKKFAQYDHLTSRFMEMFHEGKTLEEIVETKLNFFIN